MTSFIQSVDLDVLDAAVALTSETFGVDGLVAARDAEPPTTGFRGFALSLVVPQPRTVENLVAVALDHGARSLKAVKKSFWGYGGVIQAPDGTIWKVATSSKKDTGAPSRQIDDVVLLLGVEDVKASKEFYVGRGLSVDKSFGSKYVQFENRPNQVTLALYRRGALARDVGVAPDGSGPHGITIRSDAGTFTDPDGFSWEAAR